MAKDSYWFRHDSTAGRGLRMRKMAHIYGHWGKGIYWDVIEILRDQSEYKFESDESSLQMLADLIGCKDDKKFISWFKDCIRFELFIIEDTKFFSEILCENMKTWEVKKFNGSKGGRGNKTETESETKANYKAKRKLNESIREENIREENKDKSIYRQFKHLKLSLEDNAKLLQNWEQSKVDEILNRIENYQKNTKYVSLYLTALKWLEKDYPIKKDNCPYSPDQLRIARVQKESGGGYPEWFDEKYIEFL